MSKNEFYEVEFDSMQNLLKLKIIGFWDKEELFNKIIDETRTQLSKAKTGWNVVVDLSDFKTPPQQFTPKLYEMQKMIINKGAKKIAEIIPTSVVAKMAADRVAEQSGFPKRQFPTFDEALQWIKNRNA